MEVNVNVKVDLGEKTVALLTGGIAMAKAPAVKLPAPVEAKPEVAPQAEEEPQPTKTRTRRTKEQIAADEAKTASGWGNMDDDDKLEALKAEVTKHTKRGKSADIKNLLSRFDAGRASELDPKDYDAFYDVVCRYGNGESVDAIFPEEDLN